MVERVPHKFEDAPPSPSCGDIRKAEARVEFVIFYDFIELISGANRVFSETAGPLSSSTLRN